MKICSKCKKSKLETEFTRNASKPDGLHPHCKICHNKYSRDWRKRNVARIQEYDRNYRAKNTSKIRRRKHLYHSLNPEKAKQRRIKRRAQQKNAPGNGFTKKQFYQLCERYGNKCLRCGSNSMELTIDHIVPLSCGGAHSLDNIQPLCPSCNSSKGTKTIDYRE